MREVRVAVFGFVENGKFNSKQIYCMEFCCGGPGGC